MISSFKALLFLSILSGSRADNPWSKPCFDGTCTAETALYSMSIRGPKEVISDISEAADWIVLDCDPKATQQEIRIVCKGPKDSPGCKNLDEGAGPINKLVRLPPNCNRDPFVRVARSWVHDNQDLPPAISAKLASKETKVRGLAIDANFKAIPKPSAPIKFALKTATHDKKDVNGKNKSKRDSVDLAWKGAPSHPALASRDVAQDDYDDDTKLINFMIPIVNSTQNLAIIEPNFRCGSAKSSIVAHFKASVSSDINMAFGASASVKGTIIPPNVDDFKLHGNLNGFAKGSIKLAGIAKATLDSGDIVVMDVPLFIPGIPSLISIGPKFQLVIRWRGRLSMAIEQEIGFNYKMEDLNLYFPQSDNHVNSGTITPGEAPMSLKLGTDGPSSLNATVFIMPRLAFGITVPAGRADIFAEIDISGTAGLSFNKLKTKRDYTGSSRVTAMSPRDPRTELAVLNTPGTDLTRRDGFFSSMAKANLEGCAYVVFNVGVNVGASTSFFGIFNSDPNYKWKVFNVLSYEWVKMCTSDSMTSALQIPEPETPSLPDSFREGVHEPLRREMGPDLTDDSARSRDISVEERDIGPAGKCAGVNLPGSMASVYQGIVMAKKRQ